MEIKLTLGFWETMVNTWIVMAVLVGLSAWITRDLRADMPISRKQHVLEIVVQTIEDQIAAMSGGPGRRYLAFIGTLFLFIVFANLLAVFPPVSGLIPMDFAVYTPPTGALETTIALALIVFLAVPFYSIRTRGVVHWLRTYVQPSPFMLPFNIIGDITRTLALAMRLFGNMMSGTVIASILLAIAPFVFPVIMQLFGQVTGFIQAYIFATLAMVYISSAVQVDEQRLESAGADKIEGAAGAAATGPLGDTVTEDDVVNTTETTAHGGSRHV